MSDRHRKIGLIPATATVVASMIGVGIFTSPGFTLAEFRSGRLAFLAWVIGGQVAICGAVSYGALAQRLTESGGEYVYLGRRVHPWAGFVAGWTSIFAGFAGPTAVAALALESYAPWPPLSETLPLTALLSVVAIALLQCAGVWLAAWAQTTVVASKILFLAVVGAALVWFGFESSNQLQGSFLSGFGGVSPGVFATSLMWISFSYTGFNAAIYFADRVDHAERNVPRAMLLGTILTTAIYLGLVAALYVACDGTLAGDAVATPYQSLARKVLGSSGSLAIQSVISLCLVTSLWSLLLTGPHVTAKMSGDRLFPAVLNRQVRGVPLPAVLLQTTIAIVIVVVSDLQQLMTHLGMALSLCSAATVGTLLTGRDRLSGGTVVSALLYVVATCAFAVLAMVHDPWNLAGVAALLVTASAAYRVALLRSRRGNENP